MNHTAHPLDRPVWATLATQHLPLSEGGPLARRFVPDINVFGAARDDSPEALAALAALVEPGGRIYLAEVAPIAVPPGLVAVKRALGAQMVATRSLAAEAGDGGDLLLLGAADAPEMLALATLTEPGPFRLRTHEMGTFIGIRDGGRLVAMAGERFRPPGFAEVSGVCTHPDARGRGLARRLSAAMAARIQARGEQPVLHAWKGNHAAIALYESLGFVLRTEMNIAVLERPRGVA